MPLLVICEFPLSFSLYDKIVLLKLFLSLFRGTIMPMGFKVTEQMIGDDASLNFQLIVHAGDIAYAGVSASWEFEVSKS